MQSLISGCQSEQVHIHIFFSGWRLAYFRGTKRRMARGKRFWFFRRVLGRGHILWHCQRCTSFHPRVPLLGDASQRDL